MKTGCVLILGLLVACQTMENPDAALDLGVDATADSSMDSMRDRSMDAIADALEDARVDTSVDMSLDSLNDTSEPDLAVPPPPFESSPFHNPNWAHTGLPQARPGFLQEVDITDFGAVADDDIDDAPAIRMALESVSANVPLIVNIPAGNFVMGARVPLGSYRVIRGQGPDRTRVRLRRSGAFVVAQTQAPSWQPASGSITRGSREFDVADASDFAVGDFVKIVQDNDPSLMYTRPEWNTSWGEDSVGQISVVESVMGSRVTLADALNIDYSDQLNPRLTKVELSQWVGIESLKLDAENAENIEEATIDFRDLAYGWVHDVESAWTLRQHVFLSSSYRCEVSGSYFHESRDYGGGGHGYGVGLFAQASQCLVENNEFDTLRHSMLLSTGANGNVFANNYSRNPTWQWVTELPADVSIHGHYSFNNLFEGNVVQKIYIGDYWGPIGPHNLYFRNCLETAGVKYADSSHGQNIVGNDFWDLPTSEPNTIRQADMSVIRDIVEHGNWLEGQTQWDPSFAMVDAEHPSYYRTQAPTYFTTIWPSVGPDSPRECSNPAKRRFENR